MVKGLNWEKPRKTGRFLDTGLDDQRPSPADGGARSFWVSSGLPRRHIALYGSTPRIFVAACRALIDSACFPLLWRATPLSCNALTSVICILLNPVAFDMACSMILASFGQCLAKAGDVMATATAAAMRMLFMDIPPCKRPADHGRRSNSANNSQRSKLKLDSPRMTTKFVEIVPLFPHRLGCSGHHSWSSAKADRLGADVKSGSSPGWLRLTGVDL